MLSLSLNDLCSFTLLLLRARLGHFNERVCFIAPWNDLMEFDMNWTTLFRYITLLPTFFANGTGPFAPFSGREEGFFCLQSFVALLVVPMW